MPEKTPASLFNELMSPRGLILQVDHDFGEEVEVAGMVILVRVRGALLANDAQGSVGPDSEGLEHQGMLALHRPAAVCFVRGLLRERHDVLGLLLKRR